MSASEDMGFRLEPGRVIDCYTVEAFLGRGGHASVYRVSNRILGSVHALKVLDVPTATHRERLEPNRPRGRRSVADCRRP